MLEEIRNKILRDTIIQRELMVLEHKILHTKMTRLNITGGLSKEFQEEVKTLNTIIPKLKEKIEEHEARIQTIKDLWGIDEKGV